MRLIVIGVSRTLHISLWSTTYTIGPLFDRFDKDKDRIAVEVWGMACPTLEACCFNKFLSQSEI
jgi:hypothetical protein